MENLTKYQAQKDGTETVPSRLLIPFRLKKPTNKIGPSRHAVFPLLMNSPLDDSNLPRVNIIFVDRRRLQNHSLYDILRPYSVKIVKFFPNDFSQCFFRILFLTHEYQ